ncbi:MAG: MBL fold metallo-hydrolase [Clostridia bacterium]|nr:MBL fold metallo-hydrolase [Clostridia bacterium]
MLKIQKMTLGSFMTNVYFIIDEASRDCFIVDPADRCDLILEKVRSQGLAVKGILLTHAHFDHIMALEELREATGAPVMLCEQENALLCNSDDNLLNSYGDGSSCRPGDRLLREGDAVRLGDTDIKVMLLPGHTPGSCAYIFDGNMISGDTIFREGIGRYDFPGGDYAKLRASLSRIAALDADYRIYPGHGPSTTLNYEKQNNIYLI